MKCWRPFESKKIIDSKCSTTFHKICLKYNILPNYTDIIQTKGLIMVKFSQRNKKIKHKNTISTNQPSRVNRIIPIFFQFVNINEYIFRKNGIYIAACIYNFLDNTIQVFAKYTVNIYNISDQWPLFSHT